jgi:predicted YcjX-like family ATPase
VTSRLRELVISSPKGGHVALDQHDEVGQVVRVLAVRSQREAGYRGR